MPATELSGQQERWVLALQKFSFCVQHRQGVDNPADVPSRFPIGSSADGTEARLDEEGHVYKALPRVVFATEEQRRRAIEEFTAGTSVAEPGVAAALAEAAGCKLREPAVAESAAQWQLQQYMCEACCCVAECVMATVVTGTDLMPEREAEAPVPRHLQLESLQSWAGSLTTSILGHARGAQSPEGVVVVELFGGLCAGLEACLRNGWHIGQYIYVDKDPAVRSMAKHRLQQLSQQYPDQLQCQALAATFDFWPHDVAALTIDHFLKLEQLPGQILVWAGWECQDLSAAGSGRGLLGKRSSTFFSLYHVLQALQSRMGSRVAWVLENTALDVPWQNSAVVKQDLQLLRSVLGEPLVLDAAQFGSRAHRLRYYWTNLVPQARLSRVLGAVERPTNRLVQDILGPGRQCRLVARDDTAPFYCCNKKGQPMQALPTLMATVASYAFRNEGQGTIWDGVQQAWTEPTVQERELALGYGLGATAAAGASDLLRHQVLGRCMDSNVVMALVAVAQAAGGDQPWFVQSASTMHEVPVVAVAAAVADGEGQPVDAFAAMAVTAAAAQQELPGSKDIWEDAAALSWLQHGAGGAGDLSRSERSRLAHRAKLYLWQDGKVLRRMPDGSTRLVPPVVDRVGIITQVHQQAGHFGVRRTGHLVAASHWWRSLHADVAAVLRSCAVCDRVRAAFNTQQAELHPLPVEPMFYRWGVDLAGEFPVTQRGNKWVMVAVEHFSKHIELIPMRDKTAAEAAAAFSQVLCRFGAPAEVVTDGGGEWQGEFDQLLSSCFIDHRVTSAHHPQANGLAERIVQVAKRGLRKLCESSRTAQWDEQLPWVALGYRCSKQSSTKFSPYELLYARQPVFPSAVQDKLQEPIDFESTEAAVSSLLRRAEVLKERMPVAAANLKAAQRRDTLRYAQRHSKGYLPRVCRFLPGDFVYLRRLKPGSTLVIKARPVILRVKRVCPEGVVKLQDKAGQEFTQHVSQLAPCHLPDLDGGLDKALLGVDQDAECVICGSADDGHVFMFCDSCNQGWHTYCCTPPLLAVPAGHFVCERCVAAGVRVADVQRADQSRADQAAAETAPQLFSTLR